MICGLHPQPLRPIDTSTILRELKRFLGTRRKNIPLEMVRHPDTAAEILEIWERTASHLDAQAAELSIRNSDGDPLLLTTDRARLSSSERSRVETQLRASNDVREAEVDDGSLEWVIVDEADTLLGRLTIDGETLRIETNSLRRADSLRKQIENALGDPGLRWILELSDPTTRAAEDVPEERGPEEKWKLGSQPQNQRNADRTLSSDLRNVRSPCSSSSAARTIFETA